MTTLNAHKDRNERSSSASDKHADDSVAEKLRATATSTFNKAGEFAEEAKVKAKQAFDEIPKAIKEYPVQSMLVGVGIGLIAGIFLNRAMNTKSEYIH